jgi:hypothetical protein
VRTLFEEIFLFVISDTNWDYLILSSIDSNSSTVGTRKSEVEINFRTFFDNSNNFIHLQKYAGLLNSLRESYEIHYQPKSVMYFLNTCISSIVTSVCLCYVLY